MRFANKYSLSFNIDSKNLEELKEDIKYGIANNVNKELVPNELILKYFDNNFKLRRPDDLSTENLEDYKTICKKININSDIEFEYKKLEVFVHQEDTNYQNRLRLKVHIDLTSLKNGFKNFNALSHAVVREIFNKHAFSKNNRLDEFIRVKKNFYYTFKLYTEDSIRIIDFSNYSELMKLRIFGTDKEDELQEFLTLSLSMMLKSHFEIIKKFGGWENVFRQYFEPISFSRLSNTTDAFKY